MRVRATSWTEHRAVAVQSSSANIQARAEGIIMNKFPKTKNEIQDMVTAELRRFPDCGEAWGVVVVGLDTEITGATWTVSRFNRGGSDAHACDRALQVIVPHYQHLYDLAQKH
jgi:hypothetical protein